MNTPRILLCLLLTAGITRTQAQDNPAAAPAPAKTEIQKWIATTDAQWQDAFKKGITDVREAEMGTVKQQYITALEEGIKKASAANDLKGAVALRDEQKRFGDTQMLPEKNEDADALPVKAVRVAIRAQLAQVEKNNAVRAKALHGKYDAVLAQAQTQLTKAQRLDDALLVQNRRDEVKAAWITPAIAAAAENASQPTAAPTPKSPPAAPPNAAKSTAGNLFKNGDFLNGTDGWKISKDGKPAVDTEERHNGKPSVRITNGNATRTMLMQNIDVKPNSRYLISAYIKTKDVTPATGPMTKKGSKEGAELVVDGPLGGSRRSVPLSGTKGGWQGVTYRIVTNASETQITVGFALGHYYGPVTGTAWFSELSLTDLSEKN